MKLHNFTLLIPTYNRPKYLERLLSYYKYFSFPFKILIADSSNEIIEGSNLNDIISNTPEIDYHRLPPDIFLAEKIKYGCNFVKTEYAAICADDDFIDPYGIKTCLRFLANHKDYSSAQGRYIVHNNEFKKNKNFVTWKPIYGRDVSVKDNDPIRRFKSHISNYNSTTFYSVYRTKLLKEIWRETVKYTDTWGLFEIFSSGMGVILGKKKVLPLVFYASREYDGYVWYNNDGIKKMYNGKRCEKAKQGFLINLLKKSDKNKKYIYNIVNNVLNSFLDRLFLNKKNQIVKKNKFKKVINKIGNINNYAFLRWKTYKQINIIKKHVKKYKINKKNIIEIKKNYSNIL